MTTVLIVDDYPEFLDVARTMLDGQGFRVVGVALNGESALEQVPVLKPDVVLLDVQLPDIDGFEVARRIMNPPVRPVVVLTSTRDAEDYGARLDEAPAVGFIGKSQLSGARLTCWRLPNRASCSSAVATAVRAFNTTPHLRRPVPKGACRHPRRR